MTFRLYMLFMTLGTCLAFAAWMLVVWSLNPEESALAAPTLFYLTLLMSFVGLFTCIGVSVRVFLRKRREVISREVRISFRHSVFLSFLAIAALFLSAERMLTWWICLVLIGGGGIIEYLFLMREESRRS